jgi:hypothetical protein
VGWVINRPLQPPVHGSLPILDRTWLHRQSCDHEGGANYLPQKPQNEKAHRLRRLNLAVLNPPTILPLLPARETNLPHDSPVLSNLPTKPQLEQLPEANNVKYPSDLRISIVFI